MNKPSHRRGQVVDDAILEATIAEIADVATFDIKVDRVAERAGINKTTIYRRFSTVDELVLAATLRHAHAQVPMPDTGSLRDDLLAIATMVRTAISSPLGRALLAAGSGPGPFGELRVAFWQTRLSLAAAALARASERGEIPDVRDREAWIERLVGPIHFRVVQIGGTADDAFLHDLVDRVHSSLMAESIQ